jgi:hypothetical protein
VVSWKILIFSWKMSKMRWRAEILHEWDFQQCFQSFLLFKILRSSLWIFLKKNCLFAICGKFTRALLAHQIFKCVFFEFEQKLQIKSGENLLWKFKILKFQLFQSIFSKVSQWIYYRVKSLPISGTFIHRNDVLQSLWKLEFTRFMHVR